MDAALLEFWCSVDKFASAITVLSYPVPSGSHLETSVSAKKTRSCGSDPFRDE